MKLSKDEAAKIRKEDPLLAEAKKQTAALIEALARPQAAPVVNVSVPPVPAAPPAPKRKFNFRVVRDRAGDMTDIVAEEV